MKSWLLCTGAALTSAAFATLVFDKERLLAEGRTVLLELAPVDPRSLMQGDYMQLAYSITSRLGDVYVAPTGHLVVRLDERGVATFVRLDDGGPLADGELRLRYRRRARVSLGAEAYFFEEGRAHEFDAARYGELRVAPDGDSVLVGLRDKELRFLGKSPVR